jgi:hypothetical protein
VFIQSSFLLPLSDQTSQMLLGSSVSEDFLANDAQNASPILVRNACFSISGRRRLRMILSSPEKLTASSSSLPSRLPSLR